ncbi:MAG TPA: hypothetical protein VK028_02755 [Micromonosporaceae bacterium]|nr:hypothetical protein [Micromonosporaceae bacterium]
MTRRRPLYFRILGVRYLNLHPALILVLFEGSIALGLLLALAELIPFWGFMLVPVAVALAVKLNDVIEGIMLRPLAATQQRAARIAEAVAVGRIVAPLVAGDPGVRPSAVAGAHVVAPDAPAPAPAPAAGSAVAVGVAPVPAANRLRPGVDESGPPADAGASAHPVNARPAGAHADDPDRRLPNQGRFTA